MILCMSAGYKIGFLTGSKKRYIKSKCMFEKAKKLGLIFWKLQYVINMIQKYYKQ